MRALMALVAACSRRRPQPCPPRRRSTCSRAPNLLRSGHPPAALCGALRVPIPHPGEAGRWRGGCCPAAEHGAQAPVAAWNARHGAGRSWLHSSRSSWRAQPAVCPAAVRALAHLPNPKYLDTPWRQDPPPRDEAWLHEMSMSNFTGWAVSGGADSALGAGPAGGGCTLSWLLAWEPACCRLSPASARRPRPPQRRTRRPSHTPSGLEQFSGGAPWSALEALGTASAPNASYYEFLRSLPPEQVCGQARWRRLPGLLLLLLGGDQQAVKPGVPGHNQPSQTHDPTLLSLPWPARASSCSSG